MPEPLDITVRREDLARYVGELVVQMWTDRRKIEVLEARVDELDGPDAHGPAYVAPAAKKKRARA